MSEPRSTPAGRWISAWRALVGPSAAASPSTDEDPRSRLATLEMDISERDQQIRRMQEEFILERGRAEKAEAGAGRAELESLLKKLAPHLSQLATMQALAEQGKEIRAADVLKLFTKVDAVLADAGLERIGEAGAEATFDTRSHQRMSGRDVREGDPVVVRFVGYRIGETVLVKAMISRKEAP